MNITILEATILFILIALSVYTAHKQYQDNKKEKQAKRDRLKQKAFTIIKIGKTPEICENPPKRSRWHKEPPHNQAKNGF